MIKRLAISGLLLLAAALSASAQITSVTGNVTDSDGTVWANGTGRALYLPVPGFPGQLINKTTGQTLSPNPVTFSIDGSGNFSVPLPPTKNMVGPSQSAGNSPGVVFTICSAIPGYPCYATSTVVVGAGPTQSISAQVAAAIVAPRLSGFSGVASAYNDTEMQAVGGNTYRRISDGTQRCYTSSWGACSGGGGGGSGGISVLAYGALCDGSHDDTAGIQAAWNAGYAQNLPVNLPVSTQATPVVCVHHSALVVPATGAWGLKFHGNNATLKYTGTGTEISAPASNDVLIADHLNFDLTTATSSPIVFTIAGGGYSYVECDYCSDYLTGTPTASWKGASLTGAGAELNFVNSEWLSDISVGSGQFFDSGSEFYGVVVSAAGGWVNLTQTQFYPENGHTGPNDGSCFVCLNSGTGYANSSRFSNVLFHQIADTIVGVSVASGAGAVSGQITGSTTTSAGSLYSAALGTQQNLTACAVVGADPVSCSSYTSSLLAEEYQTCNAALVPTYGLATCSFTFTSAELLAFDGTIATAIPVISAPGSGRLILPAIGGAAEYVAGATPYTCISCVPATAGFFSPSFGTTSPTDLQAFVWYQPDMTQSTNQTSFAGNIGTQAAVSFPTSIGINTALYFYFAGATLTLGDGIMVLSLPYRVMPAQ